MLPAMALYLQLVTLRACLPVLNINRRLWSVDSALCSQQLRFIVTHGVVAALLAGGGRRATQGRPAAAAKSDSWDLDDELLPDGSTAKGAARVFNAMIADAQLAGCSGVPFLAGC